MFGSDKVVFKEPIVEGDVPVSTRLAKSILLWHEDKAFEMSAAMAMKVRIVLSFMTGE